MDSFGGKMEGLMKELDSTGGHWPTPDPIHRFKYQATVLNFRESERSELIRVIMVI